MDDKILKSNILKICKLTSDEENIVLERFSHSLSLEFSKLKLFQQDYGLCTFNDNAFGSLNDNAFGSLYEESLLFIDLYSKPIKMHKSSYNGFYFHRFYYYGSYQYLIYCKDYINCRPTGISLNPDIFGKYFKIIDGYKFENSDSNTNIEYDEIQETIKEFRDNDYKTEALKQLKEVEYTIKDKIDEINGENIFKIKTNIYR